ncbi:hypothetical protein KQX54_006758 [Cotesia glomerata]|uniref:Uncharacterized protein n=1 Tax=Cotesia glomerata TaxID=32391 RepID=A0AAV7IXB5_COTGL|nr:hypothetical protein KQX54_006758 [Cotesia glomerata]
MCWCKIEVRIDKLIKIRGANLIQGSEVGLKIKWGSPVPESRHPLQGAFGEEQLPVLGAHVGPEGVDPAVGSRTVWTQRSLGGVYVEVVPAVGHLLPACSASPQSGTTK